MSHLSQFNNAVYNFVQDLKTMNVLTSDILKLETYIEVSRVNARLIIRNFQTHFLRDIFVSNILTDNVEFFIDYDPTNIIDKEDNSALELIKKIQNIVKSMFNTNNENKSHISKTLNWLKILCFHAYMDLGIDAQEKFKTLTLQKKYANSTN